MYLLTEFETQNVAGGEPVLVDDEFLADMVYNCILLYTSVGVLSFGVIIPCYFNVVNPFTVVGGAIFGALYGAGTSLNRAMVIESQLIKGEINEFSYFNL